MPARKRHRRSAGPAQSAWLIADDRGAHELRNRLFDPERGQPLLVVSSASDSRRPRVDVDRLVEDLHGAADVAVLTTPQVSWTLSNLLGDELRAYGGAIRLFWPYAKPGDLGAEHPLFVTRADQDGPATVGKIVASLRRRGHLAWATGAPPWESEAPEQPVDQSEDDVVERRLARMEKENQQLRRDLRAAEDRVRDLVTRLRGLRVYADPEAQFRHEMVTSWLHEYTETDREQWPLRDLHLGPGFLESVDKVDGVSREKVVSAAVDVVTRRAAQITALRVRPYLTSPGTGTQRVRHDGATAWRANLQSSTPSARRLMWWERTDGSVELATIALHDDTGVLT